MLDALLQPNCVDYMESERMQLPGVSLWATCIMMVPEPLRTPFVHDLSSTSLGSNAPLLGKPFCI